MKISTAIISLTLAVICRQSVAQRVVVLGLDGLSSEGFHAVKHPNIDQLFEQGLVSVITRSVMPSVTLPNWTSHFTGSGPEEHGVVSNAWKVDSAILKALDTDKDGYYPSVFKLLKDQFRNSKTAFYYNWAQLINSINPAYLDDRVYQSKDGFDSLYNRALQFIKDNQRAPQLVFLYTVHTDHAGHEYGWRSPQYHKAIEKADSAIGAFINRLKKEGLYDDTYFLLITDHGGINKGHGGTSMQEMQIPWAITGPAIRKTKQPLFYNSNKNTSLVLAKIFRLKNIPASWTGVIPTGIFK